jgi:Predicted nucleotidyltransferases
VINKTPPLVITPEQWAIVRDILARHAPGITVWAFGSRATGRHVKPYSDLDLALIGDGPVSLDTLAALREAFTESDLPWKVDIVDWATTGERFRSIIASQKVVVWEGIKKAAPGG